MTSRALLAAMVSAALLPAFALGAGASCNDGNVVHPLADGGLGAETTTTSTRTASSSSAGTGATGTGGAGTGGMGTGGAACVGGAFKCTLASDCPTLTTACLTNSCTAGCCVVGKAAPSVPCTDNGGHVCDGAGKCVACLTDSQCPASKTACSTPACSSTHACTTNFAPKGTTCTGGDAGTTQCDGQGACVPAACLNGVQDGLETDVDCGGGVCAKCADGKTCVSGNDCVDAVCSGTPLKCLAPSCSDGIKNGMETDVDCGGPVCLKCGDTLACAQGSDCLSSSCIGGRCAPGSCSDGVKDGLETDVDCGGGICMPCADGKLCGSSRTNCTSNVCTDGKCQVPSCTDNVTNGQETDVDCGGPVCLPCYPGQKCLAGKDCVGGACSGTCRCPSGMVIVPIKGGVGSYCIDAVETTYGDYNVFHMANPPISTQDATTCGWNQTWTPSGDWPYPQGTDSEPVRFVNWCQAQAYCKYNGKHLCGNIRPNLDAGVDPYAAPPTSFNDFTTNQWFNACTAQGVNCPSGSAGCYPYGTNYHATFCNGQDYWDGGVGAPLQSGSLIACQGGEPLLYNMSGNVAEWEDSCSAATDAGGTGAGDNCAVRGGSYQDDQGGVRCDSDRTVARSYAGRDVGFRCCL
jgi:hypothetical protein